MKKWNEWKELLFKYCDENKQIPTARTKYKKQNIGIWLQTQKKRNIKSNTDEIYIKLSENKYVKQSLDKYLEYKKNKNM